MKTIFRKRVKSGFTITPNAVIRDMRLSGLARSVIMLILSQPDNWVVNLEWLKKQFQEGRDAISGAMKELIKAGYCRKLAIRTAGSNLVRYVWQFRDLEDVLFSDFSGNGFSGTPEVSDSETQGSGKSVTTNTINTNTIVTNDYSGVLSHPRQIPESEDEMIQTIEAVTGTPVTGTVEAMAITFFQDMESAGWKIQGEPVADWIKVLNARIEKQYPRKSIITGNLDEDMSDEDIAF